MNDGFVGVLYRSANEYRKKQAPCLNKFVKAISKGLNKK